MPVIISPDQETGGNRYQLPGASGQFAMPQLPESQKNSLPVVIFTGTAEQIDEAAGQLKAIENDPSLSELGKQQKMLPVQRHAVLSVARLNATIDVEERHWSKKEADLLAVPGIDPSNSVAAIEAREIRDWVRSLDTAERARVMDSLVDSPENEIVTLALLRSPIKMLDWNVEHARKAWNQTRRLNNPAEALAIEQGRATVEWARRGMGFLTGITRQSTKLSNDRIAESLFDSDDESHHAAYKVFGIDEGAAQRLKAARLMKQLRRRT